MTQTLKALSQTSLSWQVPLYTARQNAVYTADDVSSAVHHRVPQLLVIQTVGTLEIRCKYVRVYTQYIYGMLAINLACSFACQHAKILLWCCSLHACTPTRPARHAMLARWPCMTGTLVRRLTPLDKPMYLLDFTRMTYFIVPSITERTPAQPLTLFMNSTQRRESLLWHKDWLLLFRPPVTLDICTETSAQSCVCLC